MLGGFLYCKEQPEGQGQINQGWYWRPVPTDIGGQSEPAPMTAVVGDVCGWMATDIAVIPIPMLPTQVDSIVWFLFSFLPQPCPSFLLLLIFQIQPHPPTYKLTRASGVDLFLPEWWHTYLLKRSTKIVIPPVTNESIAICMRLIFAWASLITYPPRSPCHWQQMSWGYCICIM